MKMGSPPTARKARTGLLTPPGISCCASAKKTCERVSVRSVRVRLSIIFSTSYSNNFKYLIQRLCHTGKHRRVAQDVTTGLSFSQLLYKIEKIADIIHLECDHKFLVIQSKGIGSIEGYRGIL